MTRNGWSKLLRDRRGVALPLVVLSLVLVSVMVTSMVVTSSLESAVSGTHQDATRALFVAENGLSQFVALNTTSPSLLAGTLGAAAGAGPITFLPADAAPAEATLITVTLLGALDRDLPNGSEVTDSIYSISARPVTGGRTVAATIRTRHQIGSNRVLAFNIESAATFGMNARLTGTGIISDGSDSGGPGDCDLPHAQHAVVNAAGTRFQQGGSSTVFGTRTVDNTRTRAELISHTLGVNSLEDFRTRATIKFGYDTFSSFSGRPSSLDYPWGNRMNWACPGEMDEWKNCKLNGGVTDQYPIVVIDAGGGNVMLNGDHGQGMIVVLNGSLNIQGNFVYRGVIVGQNDIDIQGAGGNQGGAKIEGAVVAAGEVQIARDQAESQVGGSAVVRFNRCAINELMAAHNQEDENVVVEPVAPTATSLGWFEMVR